jgi:hypothetical protein
VRQRLMGIDHHGADCGVISMVKIFQAQGGGQQGPDIQESSSTASFTAWAQAAASSTYCARSTSLGDATHFEYAFDDHRRLSA